MVVDELKALIAGHFDLLPAAIDPTVQRAVDHRRKPEETPSSRSRECRR